LDKGNYDLAIADFQTALAANRTGRFPTPTLALLIS